MILTIFNHHRNKAWFGKEEKPFNEISRKKRSLKTSVFDQNINPVIIKIQICKLN